MVSSGSSSSFLNFCSSAQLVVVAKPRKRPYVPAKVALEGGVAAAAFSSAICSALTSFSPDPLSSKQWRIDGNSDQDEGKDIVSNSSFLGISPCSLALQQLKFRIRKINKQINITFI